MNTSFLKAFFATALLTTTASFALPKATEIYPKMGLGYNIGNTMEVPGDPTYWGNIFPTKEYVDGIKKAGFNTVRIPCAWDSHASNGTINKGWLDSVKTVVDFAIANDMYVMLNSHWDNGWLEDNVFSGSHIDRDGKQSTTDSSAIRKLQEAYWTQIANHFKDYDEHLLFASANEPGVNDHRGSGALYTDNGQLGFGEDRMGILKAFHEACLRAVRSTGGNNATRTIIVQVPRTEHEKASLLQKQYPVDPAGEGYTMAEFHYYPYQMAFMPADESWGKVFYYWEEYTTGSDAAHTCSGTSVGSKSDIEKTFKKMQQLFVDKGIPVVIGEMGIARHYSRTGADFEKHMEARAAWYGYTVAQAKQHGLIPVVWDNGVETTNSDQDHFTLIRHSEKYGTGMGTIVDEATINAMKTEFEKAGGFVPTEKVEVSANDKALWVTYNTKVSTKSETGTVRINLPGGKDWSNYTAISFQIRTEPVSVIGCEGDEDNGCNGYAWTSVDAFGMSTKSSTWSDFHVGSMDDFKDVLNTVTIKLPDANGSKDDGLQFADKSYVTAFGINIYATQLTGSMYLNNILLIKADGTADTLRSFDSESDLPACSGIAKCKIIDANADGVGPAVELSIPRTIVKTNGLRAIAQHGSVTATFNAAHSGKATAMLMNGLGQVVAQKSLNASAGANTVELSTNFRGTAFLVIRQGSQNYTAKVNMR